MFVSPALQRWVRAIILARSPVGTAHKPSLLLKYSGTGMTHHARADELMLECNAATSAPMSS
jgi:hypothetical protein